MAHSSKKKKYIILLPRRAEKIQTKFPPPPLIGLEFRLILKKQTKSFFFRIFVLIHVFAGGVVGAKNNWEKNPKVPTRL